MPNTILVGVVFTVGVAPLVSLIVPWLASLLVSHTYVIDESGAGPRQDNGQVIGIVAACDIEQMEDVAGLEVIGRELRKPSATRHSDW